MKKTIEKKLAPYLFPVQEREVYLEDDIGLGYKPTKMYKAIVRDDLNKLISVVPRTYKLVENREVIVPLLEQLHKLNTSWIIDRSHSFVDDGKMRLQITFPSLLLNDGTSDIALSIYLSNSYNYELSIKYVWGGIRSICSNGFIAGILLGKISRKHTSGLQIHNLNQQLENAYEKLPVLKHRIDKAANLWLLFNLITYFISHFVEMRLRSDYQLRTSRLFQL
jgi:hypothetical protein